MCDEFEELRTVYLVWLSSPRGKRAGPKGLGAESARAVTGRRCPNSGVWVQQGCFVLFGTFAVMWGHFGS